MGRLLRERLELRGELTALSPVHAGGRAPSVLSDLPLALDGSNEPYLPGTSLAGPIRAWWRRAAQTLPNGRDLDAGVWGSVEQRNSSSETGAASLIEIDDAPLLDGVDRELRQHVGISRATGAQSPGLKFDRETLPAMARLRFRLRLLRPHHALVARPGAPPALKQAVHRWGEVLRLLKGLIEAMEGGEIAFGAGKSRGLGRMALVQHELVAAQLADRTGILEHLARVPSGKGHPLAGVAAVRPPRTGATVKLTCRLLAPAMQKHDADGTLVDQMPALAVVGADRYAMIAGSGLKGAFRAQSERICRTMAGEPALPAAAPVHPLIVALYGLEASPPRGQAPRADVEPGLGALTFDDCRIGAALDRASWQAIYARPSAGDDRIAQMRATLAGSPWADWRAAALVAIDRWTGGAADGLLYGRLEPEAPSVVLTARLDASRIAPPIGCPNPQAFVKAALALFLLTLRDLARGRIPVGHGVNRGFGDLELSSLTADAPSGGPLQPFDGLSMTPDSFRSRTAMAGFVGLHDAWRAHWGIAP